MELPELERRLGAVEAELQAQAVTAAANAEEQFGPRLQEIESTLDVLSHRAASLSLSPSVLQSPRGSAQEEKRGDGKTEAGQLHSVRDAEEAAAAQGALEERLRHRDKMFQP